MIRFSSFIRALSVSVCLLLSPPLLFADAMSDRLRDLEQKVAELEKRLDAMARGADPDTRAQIEEIRRQIEVLTREIENVQSQAPEKKPSGERGAFGLGPAASKVYGLERGVSIGGYGEAIYENLARRRDDGASTDLHDTVDLTRAVFYFGYKFDRHILFNSEVEYEHATTGEGGEEKGEVAVEFAYLDFLLRREVNVRAGLVLLPVGFVNELHEPPVFLGALRPEVEQRILPTTWSELGVGLFGEAGPVAYRAYFVNGLDSAGFTSDEGIRGGRAEGSNARADDFAVVGRVDYVGVPGLLAGASAYTGESAQGRVSSAGDFGGRVSIVEGHAEARFRGAVVRGLFASGRIGDAARINLANNFTGAQSVGERFQGWYGEAGFDALFARGGDASLVPFVRHEQLDTQRRVPAGFVRDGATDTRVWTFGLQYKPVAQVVVKADYQNFDDRSGIGLDRWHLALGWLF